MKKKLITAALPYVNNVPHLGNLVQVLSADVYTRACRLLGYETLYICGTDEYGTATETKALAEGITTRELVDKFHTIHAAIYDWFTIEFDRFGRTSDAKHTEITQNIFLKLDHNGFIEEEESTQLFCETCDRFLADRYVEGTCPFCGYERARGDQCDACGRLLNPEDLKNPRCIICGNKPILKSTRHLYLDLPALSKELEAWVDKTSKDGKWANNATQIAKGWLRGGLQKRSITRDLKWGIPVPKPGFESKVFYVWFDACIGYISITASLTPEWETWWKNPQGVDLVQFVGKDNIPFHTIIFPASLLGTKTHWTMLHHIASTEYLNYETGKFSKSHNRGIFANDCQTTGIVPDMWRFYLMYNRPEKSDTLFAWRLFADQINSELIGNFANLVHRTLSFLHKLDNGKITPARADSDFWAKVGSSTKQILRNFEATELKDALHRILALSDFGNKYFQMNEPWRQIKEDFGKGYEILYNLLYLVRDLALLMNPFLPTTSIRILNFVGCSLDWTKLGWLEGITQINQPEILFSILEDKDVEKWREHFAGKEPKESPAEKQRKGKKMSLADSTDSIEIFKECIQLKVGKILHVELHPDAETLFIETIDVGEETPRTIVSSIAPFYKASELEGQNVILVANLKPAKFRGVRSEGMLLAAETEDDCEVVFVPDVKAGTPILLQGQTPSSEYPSLKIERFSQVNFHAKEGLIYVDETPLLCEGKNIVTRKIKNGPIR